MCISMLIYNGHMKSKEGREEEVVFFFKLVRHDPADCMRLKEAHAHLRRVEYAVSRRQASGSLLVLALILEYSDPIKVVFKCTLAHGCEFITPR